MRHLTSRIGLAAMATFVALLVAGIAVMLARGDSGGTSVHVGDVTVHLSLPAGWVTSQEASNPSNTPFSNGPVVDFEAGDKTITVHLSNAALEYMIELDRPPCPPGGFPSFHIHGVAGRYDSTWEWEYLTATMQGQKVYIAVSFENRRNGNDECILTETEARHILDQHGAEVQQLLDSLH
jgi:hypothetical protein